MVTAGPIVFRDGMVSLQLDLRAYRLSAIQKTGYRLAKEFTLVIDAPSDTTVHVELLFKAGVVEREAVSAAQRFFEELLDQELREQIGGETRAVRDLILAYAFSRTRLVSGH